MNDEFIKFPKTPYLVQTSTNLSRDDKVLLFHEAQIFFNEPVIIEEKVDGTNLGFSISENGKILVQNRGSYISSDHHQQYKKLDLWIADHYHALVNLLMDENILYGEWCYAKHSIEYDFLPAWFLAFDIYDHKVGKFLSTKKRSSILEGTGIAEVPLICETLISKDDINHLINHRSALYNGPVEGLYLRIEDNEGYLVRRAKVVRSEFSQAIEKHWSKTNLIVNRLQREDM